MHCPTLDELTAATLAALPRGRAWQNNDGGPVPGEEIGFDPDAFNNAAFSATETSPSWLWRYWRSFAVVLQYLTQRLCDLRMEFWCQTLSETRDEWMEEYGLPDACDPFPDLCTKVAAIGGTTCDYYAEVAARAGWSIACVDNVNSCGSHAGFSYAGNSRAGSTLGFAILKIIVYLNESQSYSPTLRFLPPRAGALRAGRRLGCAGPDLFPLQCIMARVVHAELLTVYEAA